MSQRAMFLLVLLVCVPIGWLGYRTLDNAYLSPRRELVGKITQYQNDISLVTRERADAARLLGDLRSIIDSTLGPDLETVDHLLRSRLNRIGEDIGLTSLSVSTGDEDARTSPASDTIPRKWKALREELDFIELNGFIAGEGTYAQAIELIARLEAEPWIKRLYYVRLDPKQGGERFRVQVRLTTLFLPGQLPSAPLPEGPPALDHARLAALTSANPFVVPPPVVEQPVEVAMAPPAPPRFPYEKWVMTGIVSGPSGAEVWLLEPASGETKLLLPGQQLSEMKLVTAEGDAAVFELAGKSVQLSVGQSLGEAAKE